MQSLLPHLPMEPQPAPPPPAPEPIPKGDAEALPQPPCFMELVKQAAEKALPSKACTCEGLKRDTMSNFVACRGTGSERTRRREQPARSSECRCLRGFQLVPAF